MDYSNENYVKETGLTDKDLLDLLTDIENKAYPDRLDKLSIPEFFKPKPKH